MDQGKNWEVIAMRITNEQDSQKLSELTQRLIEALDEEEMSSTKVEPKNNFKAHEEIVEDFELGFPTHHEGCGKQEIHGNAS